MHAHIYSAIIIKKAHLLLSEHFKFFPEQKQTKTSRPK